MKTAIYIEDGVVQLVITPESEFEKTAMKSFYGKELNAKVFTGSFYDCRGGWVRQSGYFNRDHSFGGDNNDNSLIIKLGKMESKEVPSENQTR